ncbi:MAG: DUF4386 domain-containing protein [Ginsengibacter sp.]
MKSNNPNTKNAIIAGVTRERTLMSSTRKHAMAAGVLYLITFVSIPTLILYRSVHGAKYIMEPGSDNSMIIGGILEIIVALACIGSAVALYPVLKKKNEGLALGLVGFRVLEAGTIFVGVMCLLTVVTLRQSAAGSAYLATSKTLVIMYDRIFFIGQSFVPAINDILLGIMLYHSRLVPRSLSLLGLVGGPILIIGDVCVLLGLIGQRDNVTGLFAVSVALFEFLFGIYLIVKGFKSTIEDDENQPK